LDRKAFIERANKWSKNRYGVTVSNRSLDDWVSEGLIPGPTRAAIPGKSKELLPPFANLSDEAA